MKRGWLCSRTATGPHVLKQPDFRAGLARLTALGLSLARRDEYIDWTDASRGTNFTAKRGIKGVIGGFRMRLLRHDAIAQSTQARFREEL
jgi:hypothetical protein